MYIRHDGRQFVQERIVSIYLDFVRWVSGEIKAWKSG